MIRSLCIHFPQAQINLPIKRDALNKQTIKSPSPLIHSISKPMFRMYFIIFAPFPGRSSHRVFNGLADLDRLRYVFPLRDSHWEDFSNLVLSKVTPFAILLIHRHKTEIVLVLRWVSNSRDKEGYQILWKIITINIENPVFSSTTGSMFMMMVVDGQNTQILILLGRKTGSLNS